MSSRKLPKYIEIDGYRIPGGFYPQAFRDVLAYKCRDDDVFLVTYPKCGTTWMHYIIYLIYHKGEIPESMVELMKNTPFPEAAGVEILVNMPRPAAIKTHLPFHLQPYSSKAKFVVIARNPKDCCVSFYHHTEGKEPAYDFKGGQFNDYFDLFMEGKVDSGDYFDHVLSWYEHRNDPNVLFLTYEEMKNDTRGGITKVAEFLGKEYGEMLKADKDILENIVANSQMNTMKETAVELVSKGESETPGDTLTVTPAIKHMFSMYAKCGKQFDVTDIFRKGLVGDWRNVFTSEQNKRMDEKIEKKLGGTELLKYWKENGAL